MSEQKLISARDSTTLAENTEVNGLNACVDWVSASFFSSKNYSEIYQAVLGIEALEQLEIIHGARYEFAGYDITYRLGKIDLMANHEKDQYLLNMSGQGCREFELQSKYDIRTLFYLLSHLQVTYNRLDIAIDDYKSIYNTGTVRKSVMRGCCVTRLKEWSDHRKGSIADPKKKHMDNFYLGNNSSRYFINFYDKKLEREMKNLPLTEINGEPVKTWTRTEVRFKYEYAQTFVGHILYDDKKPIGHHIIGFLKGKLTFLKPTALKKDSNKSRLAKHEENHAKWWLRFVKDVETLPITIKVPEHNLIKSYEWLLHQVSTSLAMLNVYDPEGFSDFLRMLTVTGETRMQKKHFKKVANQLILDGASPEDAAQVFDLKSTVTNEQIESYKSRQAEMIKNRSLEKVMGAYWDKVKEQNAKEEKQTFTEEETEIMSYYQDKKELLNDIRVAEKFMDNKKSRTAVNN